MENMTMADWDAEHAKILKESGLPWREEAIAEIERNGHYADFAGFERWMGKVLDDDRFAKLFDLWENGDIYFHIELYVLLGQLVEEAKGRT